MQSIAYEWPRASALANLAVHLEDELVCEALTSARTIGDESIRARALVWLAPYLSDEARDRAISKALAAALTSEDDWGRARAVEAVFPHLTAEQMERALSAVWAITDDWAQAETLEGLAPHPSSDSYPFPRTWVGKEYPLTWSALGFRRQAVP